MFHRETRSKSKQTKPPTYLEHYSVVQIAQKSVKKKKKATRDAALCWRLRDIDRDSDDNDTDVISTSLTDTASSYARSLGFPEPFPEFVSHLDEADVKERLNRSLPVSLWIYLFQPLLKLAQIDE